MAKSERASSSVPSGVLDETLSTDYNQCFASNSSASTFNLNDSGHYDQSPRISAPTSPSARASGGNMPASEATRQNPQSRAESRMNNSCIPQPLSLLILGTRGIPARHGGFETLAEKLSLYLVMRGWDVTIYCQEVVGSKSAVHTDEWQGVRRVNIPVRQNGAIGTMVFDWRAIRHAFSVPGIPLILGYNTAIFSIVLRLRGRPIVVNMDGIEWRRDKWSGPAKAWLWLNDWVGSLTSSVLIADHPEIVEHLATRRKRSDIVLIPYGGDSVIHSNVDSLSRYGLEQHKYLISVCRIEPENSILPMICAFSRRPRGLKFLCVGEFEPDTNDYHRQIRDEASAEIYFPGPIYEPQVLASIREYALGYCHGHTVGGTNPSLVEALGAGNAVIAHRNRFNLWTAGQDQFFFCNEDECAAAMDSVEMNPARLTMARAAARRQHSLLFTWEKVLAEYESLLARIMQCRSGKSGEGFKL
jgi:glycosyltransferase involved in cell wall biosynthesis